ncbi:GH25 family lysozyme [Nonomuraea rubra]|uniref:GH25 family lysozyme n=1 Tax=Nonomuraea rubra TaxID=46180 RepID=UPI0036127201
MKRLLLLAAIATVGMTGVAQAADGVPGVDVSNWTGDIDWASVASGGGKFAFVQATEGADYTNPRFAAQYDGAAAAGLIRGAYHFAQPHETDGTAQADYFLQHGGNWVSDGRTLPGVLDIEDNPYKDTNGKNNCYDLSVEDMVGWLKAFTKKYHEATGRHAIIYTTTSWWQTCTGNSDKFKSNPSGWPAGAAIPVSCRRAGRSTRSGSRPTRGRWSAAGTRSTARSPSSPRWPTRRPR